MKYKLTYINQALHNQSYIDNALVSCFDSLSDFSILDPDVNFSDHLPIRLVVTAKICSSGSSELNNFDQSIFIQHVGIKLTEALIMSLHA